MTWRGNIFFETGWLLYDGPVTPTDAHAHHAFQIMLAAAPPVAIASDSRSTAATTIGTEVACIPPDVLHAFASASQRVAILYIAPESRAGRQLANGLAGASDDPNTWISAGAALRGVCGHRLDSWEGARAVVDAALGSLITVDVRARPWPPVIQRLVKLLPDRLDRELRFGALAAELDISEGRLAHLVTEYLGIPFRPYVLWLRLQRSAVEIARGRAITEAAHHAGFSDGAHLSRTFKRMFGIAPSEVASFAQWHVAS